MQAHQVSLTPVVDLGRLSYVDVLVWTPQTRRDERWGRRHRWGVERRHADEDDVRPAPTTTKAPWFPPMPRPTGAM